MRRVRDAGGAALVVAMVVLLLVSIISVTGANRALLGQQMASNQHLQTQAFFAAETGIAMAREIANTQVIAKAVAGGDASAIESAWDDQVAQYEGWTSAGSDSSAGAFKLRKLSGAGTYWNNAQDAFDVVSQGRFATGGNSTVLSKRTVAVEISPAQAAQPPPSPFIGAIIGRDGVSFTGGSAIDLYDSALGKYDASVRVNGQSIDNTSKKSSQLSGIAARTCVTNGTITLSGNAPVYGDLIGTGDIQANGATPVYGNVHVNGNASGKYGGDFNGHVYGNLTAGGSVAIGNASTIEGNVIAGGAFSEGGTVKGTIAACVKDAGSGGSGSDTASFSSSSTTESAVTAACPVSVGSTGSPPPSIQSSGAISYPGYYKSNFPNIIQNYSPNVPVDSLGLPSITPVQSSNVAGCNAPTSKQIAQTFSQVRNNASAQLLTDWLTPPPQRCYLSYSDHLCFRENGSSVSLYGDDNGAVTLGTSGAKTILKVENNLDTSGHLSTINIKGDVTLLVDGNFDLGGATTLHVDQSSSLTLLVTGTATFSSGSDLTVDGPFVRNGVDGQPRAAVLVYSAYQSGTSTNSGNDYGVTVGGSNDSFIAVYAPLASVKVQGSGAIYGSVVSQSINVTGSGDIHYDRSLQKISVDTGNGASGQAARIKRWWQLTGT